jgi:hypothetical protein
MYEIQELLLDFFYLSSSSPLRTGGLLHRIRGRQTLSSGNKRSLFNPAESILQREPLFSSTGLLKNDV